MSNGGQIIFFGPDDLRISLATVSTSVNDTVDSGGQWGGKGGIDC